MWLLITPLSEYRRITWMDAIGQPDIAESNPTSLSGKNIVHVVRQYSPSIGGLEDVVRNLALQQKDRVASVRIVTLDRLFTDPGTSLLHHDVIDGIEVVRIPYSGSSRYPLAPSVLGQISDADLVHVHAIDFFFDFLAMTRPVHRRKLVATTHGGFFHTRNFARLKSVWFNTLTRFSASQYSALACCSTSDLDLFNKISPGKSVLIENGVAIEKFRNAAALHPERRLLTLGRFSSNKRLECLIEMMAVLCAEDPRWHLDIAGMESDLTRNELLQMAETRGVSGNVDVHVGLTNTQLRDLITRCSLFVSASEYEGFGLVLIEALSAGLIPVVEANEAFRVIAEKHSVVRTVDYSKPRQAADVVKSEYLELEQRPDLREDAVHAARAYGWPSRARQYEDLYRSIFAA